MDTMDGGLCGRSSDLMLAPFLSKTYDMVDDVLTDDIVSWSPSSDNSFVVWTPSEFCTHLLPKYFKHNNFSSFLKQLNTYGFRKVHPERWEFSNEGFVRSQKHLLKNIIRRKPSTSSSHDQQQNEKHQLHEKKKQEHYEKQEQHYEEKKQARNILVEACKTGIEEEILNLKSYKYILMEQTMKMTTHQQSSDRQIMTLSQKINDMQQWQQQVMIFLAKAIQTPDFVSNIAKNKDDLGLRCNAVDKKAKKRRFIEMKKKVDDCKNMFSGQNERYRPSVVNDTERMMSQLMEMEASSAREGSISISHYSSLNGSRGKSIESSSCGSSTVLPNHLFNTAMSSYNAPILEEEISVPAHDYPQLVTTKTGDVVAPTSIPSHNTGASSSIPHQTTNLDCSNVQFSNENDAFWGDVLVENLMMPSTSVVEESENRENNLYMKNLTDKMDQLYSKH